MLLPVALTVTDHHRHLPTESLYIKRGKVSVTYVHSSVTVGVANSIVNDVIMRTGAASAVGTSARRQNENDVTVTIAGLWRYDDWRHVATGCTALVLFEM